MRRRSVAGLAVMTVFIGIQFIPVNRSNPPVHGEIQAPRAVSEVLQRSCYDCHSNETEWPWYSHVAPVSWVLVHHVDEGREEFNFSTWSELAEKDRSEIIHEIWEETSEGKMPLRSYLVIHPEAKLSEADIETLRKWSGSSKQESGSD